MCVLLVSRSPRALPDAALVFGTGSVSTEWAWRLNDDNDGLTDGFFEGATAAWLRVVLGTRTAQRETLPAAIETFFSLWADFALGTTLAADDRRTGDALAMMANELAKSDDPPKGVLREAFGWFARKLETFADEFVKGAGKTTGVTFGVALGATAGGQLPHLIEAAKAVQSLL